MSIDKTDSLSGDQVEVSTSPYSSSTGDHERRVLMGPYLIVGINSQRPFDRPLQVPIGDAQRVSFSRGTERIVRRSTRTDGNPEGDVFIVDSKMSARHAFIARDERGHMWLWDCGSKNGTTLNGAQVAKPCQLFDGDVFGVGSTFLMYRCASEVTGSFSVDSDPLPPSMTSLHPVLSETFAKASQLSSVPFSVLITGPNGSGRRTLARSMHEISGRPGTLVEVESKRFMESLFSFSANERGTLYLRDIDQLSEESKSVVCELIKGNIVPKRSGQVPKQDTLAPDQGLRLIASGSDAASSNLEGDFARLFGERILPLPSLAYRREDLGRLVGELLEKHGAPSTLRLERTAARALSMHLWPGNISELEDALCLGLSYLSNNTLSLAHLPKAVQDTESFMLERRRLISLLSKHKGDITKISRELGKSRRQIYRMLDRQGIEIKTFRPGALR